MIQQRIHTTDHMILCPTDPRTVVPLLRYPFWESLPFEVLRDSHVSQNYIQYISIFDIRYLFSETTLNLGSFCIAFCEVAEEVPLYVVTNNIPGIAPYV